MKAATRIMSAAMASVAITGAAGLAVTQAQAAPKPVSATACATHWGVAAKVVHRAETAHTAKTIAVRAGKHACFERLVIDLGAGREPGFQLRYVHAVRAQGSGQVVKLRGHAALQITLLDNAVARFPAIGHSLVTVRRFGVIRQVLSVGSFEGYTEVGVGVRSKVPFRVVWLEGPGKHSRLVIDIAAR